MEDLATDQMLMTILNGKQLGKVKSDFPVATNEPIVLQQHISYITGVVIINDKNEVLMIQEAKKSCRGLWCFPCGRMEQNESIIDAVKREALEESGYEIEPKHLMCVDAHDAYWIRFIFSADIIGGRLKSLNDADGESLQAAWIPINDVTNELIPLRHHDIHSLLEIAQRYRVAAKNSEILQILPIAQSHDAVYARLIFVAFSSGKMNVLLHTDGGPHIPVLRVPSHNSITCSMEHIIKEAFGQLRIEICGILSVEHTGKCHGVSDGVCFTCLATVATPYITPTQMDSGVFIWHETSNQVLMHIIRNKMSSNQLSVLYER